MSSAEPNQSADPIECSAIAAPENDEVLVVVGETASGKSAAALALAQRLGGEIIGADSVQIYRYFDQGSGKPSPEDRNRCPHHLVDFVEPDEPFDVARYVALADAAIAQIRERGHVPIVCGGTFLWMKALLQGLAPAPPADAELRRQHQEMAEQHGRPAVHAKLAEVDPASAARLAPNDLLRVSRALEVFTLSGRTMTSWQEEHAFQEQRYRSRFLRVARERSVMDERIRTRARNWLEHGWIEEVQQLRARGFGECRAMRSVGYREVHAYVSGELTRDELEEAIVRVTRPFARRQRTWIRDLAVTWLK